MRAADPIYQELLQHTRCLVVTLDNGRDVAAIECPWGVWDVDALRIGDPLPEPLKAVLDATPPDDPGRLYPFVYLNDLQVADVLVCTRGAHRRLVLRDVREVHGAELRFQQKAHEVSLLLERQEELTRQLERANAAKSRFIAAMSHEFRTPISAIMGRAELLARQTPDGEAAAAIQRASWHLLTLVENLLEQARLGEGIVQINPARVDPALVLEDMRQLFEPLARSKGLDLSVGQVPPGVWLETDELRLRQVLINLLGNAVRYTSRGRVGLETAISGGALEFRVSDTGPGIEPGEQRRIFEPFTRLRPGEQTGAGLGLAVSRQLVEAMGGHLELDSQPGRGSVFHFALPLAGAETAAQEPELAGLRILLVDDDPDVLAVYELFLKDWGMVVYSAASLPEALRLAEREAFDLALTDLQLQQGSGADLLDRMRDSQPDCRTVLCSGAVNSADWETRYDRLADAFLLKPVSPERLRATLAGVLGGRSAR